jgi:AAA+ superfamily predicted ATPase
VLNHTNIKFKDLNGRRVLNTIKKFTELHKKTSLAKKFDLKRTNRLFFHGPPGTGKTFAAKAIAGELNYPLINISAANFYNKSPYSTIHDVIDISKRYKNCIVFIDEAEKLIGNQRYGEDSPIIGELNRELEGVSNEPIQAILIMATNDKSRFGTALKDRFIQIQFDNPNTEERKNFIQTKIKQFHKTIDNNITPETLAKITDGMSYREIERLQSETILKHIETKQNLNTTDLQKIIKEIKGTQELNVMFG